MGTRRGLKKIASKRHKRSLASKSKQKKSVVHKQSFNDRKKQHIAAQQSIIKEMMAQKEEDKKLAVIDQMTGIQTI